MFLLAFISCAEPILEAVSQKEEFIIVQETTEFPLNEEFSFVFSILDSERNPSAPDEVLVDAEMPEHGHGMGQTATVSNSQNQYTAEGMLFAMEGEWDINIFITQGNSVDQATFSIVCCE